MIWVSAPWRVEVQSSDQPILPDNLNPVFGVISEIANVMQQALCNGQ